MKKHQQKTQKTSATRGGPTQRDRRGWSRLLWGASGLLALVVVAGIAYRISQPVGVPVSSAAARVPTAPAASGGSAPAATMATGPKAPAFQVASLNAGTIRVPGAEPTVVYFMSASCGTCFNGEQELAAVAATAPSAVHWISLDVDPGYDTPQAVLSMARYTGARWPQAFGTNAILQAYHVTALDMVAVIAKNGTLLYDGALPSRSALHALIQQAIEA